MTDNGQDVIQARVTLKDEQQRRIEKCNTEIEKILQEYECRFDIAILLKAGQVIPQLQIIANS